ncbi:hypothetical protein V493_01833 [Pseudogymnoascus sp. VKM F-4281 (FW-2241)]|nr:hypothetical protein V493_01833 [Pseudogymnoascus sp. VKM F-4281 (FW-2241)]
MSATAKSSTHPSPNIFTTFLTHLIIFGMNLPPRPPGKGSVPLSVDMSRGTKRNKEKLTLQVRCDGAELELDSGKDALDVAVSHSSAMADYPKHLKSILSSGYNGSSDDSSGPSLPAIAEVDKISVDSQGVGVDGSTAAEPLKQLKAHYYEGASRGAHSKTDVLSLDTSKLSPPSQLTPKKRPSEEDLKGDLRAKKNKTEELTPQSLCSADNPGIAVSSPSATSAKVHDTGVEDKSKIRNDAINDDASDTIIVDDDQDMGETRYTDDELKEQLKGEIEQLALKDLIRIVPNWRSNVTFLRKSTPFDKESYENLNNLVKSIQRVIRKNEVRSGIITELKELLIMCEAASEIHQSHGRCYRDEQKNIEILITEIEGFATILTRNYKTDVVDENYVAGPSCGGLSG